MPAQGVAATTPGTRRNAAPAAREEMVMGFCAEQLERHASLWRRMLTHPFLIATRDGTIAYETFARWMRQDYLFVEAAIPFIAALLPKAPRAHWQPLAGVITALEKELELFAERARAVGVELGDVRPAFVNHAYVQFLLATALRGGYAGAFTVLVSADELDQLRADGYKLDVLDPDWYASYAAKSTATMGGFLTWMEAVGGFNSKLDSFHTAYPSMIGGIERSYDTGHISYDPDNHRRMTEARFEKVARIADDIPAQAVNLGSERGKLAFVGLGSTYGPIRSAVARARAAGHDVSHIHLRYLNPFPRNLGDLLRGFDRILVPEMNYGQLVAMLRSTFMVPAEGLNKVTGKPFMVAELEAAIRGALEA